MRFAPSMWFRFSEDFLHASVILLFIAKFIYVKLKENTIICQESQSYFNIFFDIVIDKNYSR